MKFDINWRIIIHFLTVRVEGRRKAVLCVPLYRRGRESSQSSLLHNKLITDVHTLATLLFLSGGPLTKIVNPFAVSKLRDCLGY